MTAERRLAKVEASLGPKELVLRWLAEAHAHHDFEAYARATYALGPDGLPLDRLVHETLDWVSSTQRGRSRDERDHHQDTALRQVLFLYHLVLRTIVLAQEALDREVLLYAVISAHLALAVTGTEDERGSAASNHAARLAMLRRTAMARVTELRALEAARAQVEAHYLDGHQALFPATIRSWTEQFEKSEQLADLANRLAELDDLDPMPLDDPDTFSVRVEQLVADHVEPARVKALDEMGEGRRAVTIAIRWLRPKLLADPEMD